MSDSLRPHVLQRARLPWPPFSCDNQVAPFVNSVHIVFSTFCDPMDCSMPGFPVVHYLLLKFMSIQSVMLSSHLIFCHPFLLFLHHQGLFQCEEDSASDGQSIGALTSASVLPMNIQGWFPLGLNGWISLKSKGLLRVFSSITIWKHQFFSAHPSLWANSQIHTWLLEKL